MKNDSITVVSGLPRSGTSLMMQMLAAGGMSILTDGERQADVDNHRGYYEWERIKRKEREGRTLAGITPTLPPLLKAYRLQERAASVGCGR